MARASNLLGQVFTRLTVVERGPNAGVGVSSKARWWCNCICGSSTLVYASALRHGLTRSCGCLNIERAREDGWKLNRRHGMTKTRTHICWDSMLQRCCNPNHKSFEYYGGRGIQVCKRWHAFENFLADMGEVPPGMSLDRVDVNRGYEPGNCRWATAKEQGRNRRNNRLIAHHGETRPLSEWAELHGISRKLLRDRLEQGWPMDRACPLTRTYIITLEIDFAMR